MSKPDFLVIGAGIFGITTAIELRKKKYSVTLINPDTIPHPLAASTDISKVVRMEYGTDLLYFEMAEASMEGWRNWNDLFKEKLYHEVGYFLASKKSMDAPEQAYEKACYDNLLERGYEPERLDAKKIAARFPAFSNENYTDGFFNPVGGFVEASKSVEILLKYAIQLGVTVHQNQTADSLMEGNGKIVGANTREGEFFEAGHTVVCAGANTPYLVPELMPYMRITGHPVFHLKVSEPKLFTPPKMAVFAADISNSGWYGFPIHPREDVVKIALHSDGLELHPEQDERVVTEADTQKFRNFLKESLPTIADDPIVFTRRCVYTDTLDGHFWIDRHCWTPGLTIGSGGSGHGLKMGPVIGKLIATVAEGGDHKWLPRFRWRDLAPDQKGEEEARFFEM